MNLALFSGSDHRFITIADHADVAPAWQAMFDWPVQGDRHVGLSADTIAARNLFAVQLDQAVAQADRAVLLVASGVGCLAAAWWARLSPVDYVARVAGALLFAPEQDAASDGNLDRFASPRVALPFPSIVIDRASVQSDRRRLDTVAAGWGSRILDAQDTGDVIASMSGAGLSPWRHAQRTIERWSAAIVAHDERVAAALSGQGLPRI